MNKQSSLNKLKKRKKKKKKRKQERERKKKTFHYFFFFSNQSGVPRLKCSLFNIHSTKAIAYTNNLTLKISLLEKKKCQFSIKSIKATYSCGD